MLAAPEAASPEGGHGGAGGPGWAGVGGVSGPAISSSSLSAKANGENAWEADLETPAPMPPAGAAPCAGAAGRGLIRISA